MNKKKILFTYMAYPFAIASYFREVLEKRPDVELFTAGAYTGDNIPWNGGMRIPMKYVKPVDLPLPQTFVEPAWEMVRSRLPWTPDLIINCDAGWHFRDKPSIPYAVIGTDPHVLQDWYNKVRPNCDYFFNMQRYYMQAGDVHLPYACAPTHHFAMSNIEKEYDASLIGLHYPQRDQLVGALRFAGKKVLYTLGLVYEEYRIENNKARIGLNWSSLMDINARTFEIMAMRQVPVINRLPHLDELGLIEGEHYIGFDNVAEGVTAVDWALKNPEKANQIATIAYNLVNEKHTYEKRVQQIFDTIGI